MTRLGAAARSAARSAAWSVVAAASLAACGGQAGRSAEADARTALDVVRTAPGRTVAAGTARYTAASGANVVEGTIDLSAGRASARLRGPAVAGQLAVELDYARAYAGAAPPAPAEAAALAPATLLGAGAQPGNPLVALDLLGAVTEAEPYGGTALHGVPTFRYELTVDPRRVPAMVADERRRALTAATRETASLPGDVWIDAEGRVRRVQFGNDLAVATTTTDRRGFPVATTVDLFDFGAPVPPAGGMSEPGAGRP